MLSENKTRKRKRNVSVGMAGREDTSKKVVAPVFLRVQYGNAKRDAAVVRVKALVQLFTLQFELDLAHRGFTNSFVRARRASATVLPGLLLGEPPVSCTLVVVSASKPSIASMAIHFIPNYGSLLRHEFKMPTKHILVGKLSSYDAQLAGSNP
jgi:hypothetical protein